MGVAKFARILLEFPFWTDVISLGALAITIPFLSGTLTVMGPNL